MKSIKEHEQPNERSPIHEVQGQALWYSRCCILSVSLMSGMGIPWNYDSARVGGWLGTEGSNINMPSLPENPTILRAVYKKGEPKYINAYNGQERDYKNYLWDDSSFKKIITPTSQSYLIMDEIMLAKYFKKCADECPEDKKAGPLATAALLIKSADIQSQFMSDNMRNEDGLFVSKSDLSSNPFGDPALESFGEEPDVSDQAFALYAFSMMAKALNDQDQRQTTDKEASDKYLNYADEIYEVFQDSPEDIFEGKTRDLCNVIPACIEFYNSSRDNSVLEYITTLSLELESRIDMSGNLLRFPYDSKLTSNASCFNAINTLIKAYRITEIEKFLSSTSSLYKKLNLLWNPVDCLYSLDEDEKYKYTSRDVGSVLSGLNALRLFGEPQYSKDAEQKLLSFFNSAVNSSRLVQSTLNMPRTDEPEWGHAHKTWNCILSSSCFSHPEIPLSLEINTAPVFAKKFSLKPKKHKFDINSSSFYSEYSLYTAWEMLQMNYPDVDCFYAKHIHPEM